MGPMRVAIVIQDVIGPRLAGPAIRALAMGRALAAAGHDVQVRSLHAADHPDPLVVDGGLGGPAATGVARWADVIVVQGDVLGPCDALARGDGTLVCDLYDPVQMEGLARGAGSPLSDRFASTRHALGVLSTQLERGDLFLCASERQRLFWLGHLDAAGRVNPSTYDADPTLSGLLAVVPFGIEDAAPVHDGVGLRGRVEGIVDTSRTLLWGGGVYDWLDPLPVIEATARLRSEVPELRLVFMGTTHPNPTVPPSPVLARARGLVEELGVGEVVIFHEGWVPYEEWHNVLLEAEIGVSGHLPHVETDLAFRTRILDYIWAGLPVVTTRGDALGDVVAAEGLGAAVPPGDAGAVADALRALLVDDAAAAAARRQVAAVAPRMRWSAVLQPVLDHCQDPRPASDRGVPEAGRLRTDRSPRGRSRLDRGRALMGSARESLAEGGLGGLALDLRARLEPRRPH